MLAANSAPTIPFERLVFAFIPVIAVLMLLRAWGLNFWTSSYGVARMLVQLLLIGYMLGAIFAAESSWVVIGVLMVMLIAASWISLRSIQENRREHFRAVLVAILMGGGCTLMIVTQLVLNLEPWYLPRVFIPLAGMIFSNCMNTVSLVAERYASELGRNEEPIVARNTAIHAALIPITNSLFAVGLVSIPGMMTGQVLAGISPLIAARYQIMVMCMVYGSSGLSASLYLVLNGAQGIGTPSDASRGSHEES